MSVSDLSDFHPERKLLIKFIEDLNEKIKEIPSFGNAGCTTMMLVVDDFTPEDSFWYGLKGTDEQIAASFHFFNDEDKMSRVQHIVSLCPVEDWVTSVSYKSTRNVTASLEKAIAEFNVLRLREMSPDEAKIACATLVSEYDLIIEQEKKSRASPRDSLSNGPA